MKKGLKIAVLALLTLGTAPSVAAVADAPTLESLTVALHNTTSVRDIKRLQRQYGQMAEAGDWQDMANLFTEDGVMASPSTEIKGRDAIHAALRADYGNGMEGLEAHRLNVHLFLSPVVTMGPRGDTAMGRWHELAMLGTFGESADWRGGIHEVYYRLTKDGWKIARDRYYPQYDGSYTDGWRSVADFVPMAPFHYNNPTRVGLPFESYTDAVKEPMSAAEIAAGAQALLNASAVQNLQAAYGFYVDRRMWTNAADLFTEDAVYEASGHLAQRGRDGVITALTREDGPQGLETGVLNDHLQLMPVVTVAPDGKTAQAQGFELMMLARPNGSAHWGLRVYVNDYMKNNGTWKIRHVRLALRFLTDYDKGWAKDSEDARPGSISPTSYPRHRGVVPPVDRPQQPLVPGKAPSLKELARMIRVAQAYDAAENVSTAYGYYIDEFRWDDTADLFATDGWKELSYIGNYIGREHIRGSLFARYGDQGRRAGFMAIHQKVQPYVTVAPDGRSAQIRLHLLQINSASAAAGSYTFGIYENQVKIDDGVWKIAGMDLDYSLVADYKGGWAAIRPDENRRFAPSPESIALYPPDGPLRGVTYAPFPEVAPMGFHFDNPVSGRTPDVKLDWRISKRP